MRGFTLIEVVVALGVLAVIFAMGLPVSLNFYLDYSFDYEVELVSGLLKTARTQAISNINEANHGLRIETNDLIVFEGSSYATRNSAKDAKYPRNTVVSIAGASELVFSALSGQVASTTLTMNDGRKSRFLFINPEGLVYE